jgi:AcrR family transcriptional regulator
MTMPPIPVQSPATKLLDAACALLAEEGIKGLSMRKLAGKLETSLGSLTHHTGSKAELTGAVIGALNTTQRKRHEQWLARGQNLDFGGEGVLAAMIAGYLDEAATIYRVQAIALCELVLEAAHKAENFTALPALIAAEEGFWRTLLRDDPEGADLASVIANYCWDELPFTLAVGHNPDYRLLRFCTMTRLAGRFRDTHDHGLNAAFAAWSRRQANGYAPAPGAYEADAKRARLGGHIAAIIGNDGVSAVTHRAVAAAAAMPHTTIAHHFRTRDDLLRAGIEALYLGAAVAIGPDSPETARLSGFSYARATHAMALAAARDPSLAGFALDFRRRRAELSLQTLPKLLGETKAMDGAALQAATMVLIGGGIALYAQGKQREGGWGQWLEKINRLRRLGQKRNRTTVL